MLGGLLTELATVTLPPSAARQFFITTVAASLQPLAFDLKVLAFTLGPIVLRLKVLSVVGVVLVAWFRPVASLTGFPAVSHSQGV